MPQYQGVWSLQSAAQLQSTQQWVTDPNFKDTTLLLQADPDVMAAQNNTFLDSSSNSFAITRNGNTTQGTFTPFSTTPGTWSNSFDGTSDYLTATGANLAMGTGNFTIEFWFYANAYSATADSALMFDNRSGNNTSGFFIGPVFNNTQTLHVGQNTTPIITANRTYPLGVWVHCAVVRSSGVITLYQNGVNVGSVANTTNNTATTNYIASGWWQPTGAGQTFNGHLTNLRISNTARYTANFTPPATVFSSDANTVLLTCQNNRFVDNSSNAYPITSFGTASVHPFSLFAPQFQWTPSVIGGAGYGGSGVGYLRAPASSNFQYPGDVSIETWVYTTTSNTGPIWGTAGGGGSDQIYLNTSSIFYDNTNFSYFNRASSVVPYSWNHICMTRQSGTLRMFINGILIGSKSQSATLGSATTSPGIFIRASLDDQIAGPTYMTDLRVCKGSVPTSYQTSSTTAGAVIFTPPTQPVTTTSQGATSSNVSLLLNFTNAGIYDGTMKNSMETVGNAQVSTAVVKHGTGSIYIDGSGDNCLLPYNPGLHLSGDFTIELWIYPLAYGGMILNMGGGVGIGWASYELVNQSDGVNFAASSTNSGYDIGSETGSTGRIGTIPLRAWSHLAVTRSGNVYRGFVNGIQGYTQVLSLSPFNTAPRGLAIGSNYATSWGTGTPTDCINGYIDDLRITKGVARYTQNFTPPSVALPRQ